MKYINNTSAYAIILFSLDTKHIQTGNALFSLDYSERYWYDDQPPRRRKYEIEPKYSKNAGKTRWNLLESKRHKTDGKSNN